MRGHKSVGSIRELASQIGLAFDGVAECSAAVERGG